MSDNKLYYVVKERTYSKPFDFKITRTSEIRDAWAEEKDAIDDFEQSLVRQLDYTLERLVEDRQKLIDFRNWKAERSS